MLSAEAECELCCDVTGLMGVCWWLDFPLYKTKPVKIFS